MMCGRAALLLCLAWPALAAAQSDPSFRPKQLTVSAGAVFAAGYPIGDTTADLRRNTTPSTPFPLLRAESDIERASGLDARIGVAVSRSLEVEVGATYSTPQLTVTISQDDELGEAASAAERLSQYTVDVSGAYLIPRVSLGSRLRPYVIGGGGYLRQLHEGRLRVETGRTMHLGGGLRYWARGGRVVGRSFGARAEARYVRRTGGIEFDDRARSYPTVSVMGFVVF